MMEDLLKSYEDDVRKHASSTIRRLAVISVLCDGMSVTDVANQFRRDPGTIRQWIAWYKEDGVEGLEDRPRSGRPRKIPKEDIAELIDEKTEKNGGKIKPIELRDAIKKNYNVKFCMSYICKILRGNDMSPKTTQPVHVRNASSGAVYSWRCRMLATISRLKKKGYKLLAEDETFLRHESKNGKGYWSKVGSRIRIPYSGNKNRLVVLGAAAENHEGTFRITRKKFTGPVFLSFVKHLAKSSARSS